MTRALRTTAAGAARTGALAVVAALLPGCLAEPPPRDPSQWPVARLEIERAIPTEDPAEQIFRAHCIACHGVDGRGAGGATGANFTAPDGPLTQPDERLLVSILEGRRGEIGVMPAHRDVLGEARSRAVLAYIRARFGAGIEVVAAAAEGAAPDAGAEPVALNDAEPEHR